MAENIGDIIAKAWNRVMGNKSAEKEKKTLREGEETLKKTLNRMYEQYKNSVSPKPDYDEKYGATEVKKPEIPRLRGDDVLREEAENTAAEAYREKRGAAEQSKEETAERYALKKKDAAETYRESLKSAEERAAKAKADAEAKIAAQGLGNSTVSEGLRTRAEQYANAERENAEAKFRNAITVADEKIRTAEEKLAGALKTFEIAEAAKTEKELSALKKERESALKQYASDYDAAIKNAEKAAKDKSAGIAADEKARDEEFRKSLETSAGAEYNGAEAAEMENRYRVAESFYSSVPKDKARSLIANSAEDLKFLLGNYYERLMTALKLN